MREAGQGGIWSLLVAGVTFGGWNSGFSVRLRSGGTARELELGAAKQRALLAVLLLHAGETMSTERLVDALWGEKPPATAVKALQVYVSQLRKTLGEGVVETRPLGYVVRVEDGALDLQRFERLLDEGRRLLDEGAAREAGEVLRRGARAVARAAAGGLPLRGVRGATRSGGWTSCA